jgi:hypothetical protein
MLSVIILSVIMLSVIMLTVIMLTVIMLSVIMHNVIVLNVMAPLKQMQKAAKTKTVWQKHKTFFLRHSSFRRVS